MRSSGPSRGTPLSSLTLPRSVPKSTSAWNWPMSPVASALAWSWSRHQAGPVAVPAGSVGFGYGSVVRNATLKNAGGDDADPAPPGWEASAAACGIRYFPATLFHSPTPAAKRTTPLPGSHAVCGTRTSIWRRVVSTETVGEPPATGVLVPAWTRSATMPEPAGGTGRNMSAGARTLAPSGNGMDTPCVPPMAIENATSDGSFSVFSVTRNAVASASGFTRTSTKSAALFAYAGAVGYVYVPFVFENVLPAVRASVGSTCPFAPPSS